jgi:hypothetical protein
MGKHHFQTGVLFGPSASRGGNRCIACKRHIVYGERCRDCERELRQRHKRKRR